MCCSSLAKVVVATTFFILPICSPNFLVLVDCIIIMLRWLSNKCFPLRVMCALVGCRCCFRRPPTICQFEADLVSTTIVELAYTLPLWLSDPVDRMLLSTCYVRSAWFVAAVFDAPDHFCPKADLSFRCPLSSWPNNSTTLACHISSLMILDVVESLSLSWNLTPEVCLIIH